MADWAAMGCPAMATASDGTSTRSQAEPLPDGRVGPASTVLIVIRGNSASGKSSVARAIRDACGRGLAWVEQDHVCRILQGCASGRRFHKVLLRVVRREAAEPFRQLPAGGAGPPEAGQARAVLARLTGESATTTPFEGFSHAEAGRSHAYGGSGLGPAVVEAIIHAHYGQVPVDSAVGAGTTVALRRHRVGRLRLIR